LPVPKVIDFGIAKAVEGRLADRTALTEFEQVIGTPAYMSPEQANAGDLDTRSDIYSLGVVLYELLTGRTPFDAKELLRAGLNAARSAITERDVARPSERLRTTEAAELATIAERRGVEPPQLVHAIRGDLDWIVLKALAKDRQRRYPTANELAADVERHRRDEPVLARPPSAAYQAIKFTRRHRTAAAAATLAVGALLTGLALAIAGYRRAETARRAAVTAREEAVAVTGFFTKMLSYADPWLAGPDVSVKSVLDRAASTLSEDFKDRPAAELRIHDTIAETYAGLGQYDLMAQHAARAAVLARSVYGPDAVETLQLEASEASGLTVMGRPEEGEKELRRVLAVAGKSPGYNALEIGYLNRQLVLSLEAQGRFDEAVETELSVLATFKAHLAANDWDIVHAEEELARMLSQQGQCARAREVFGEALATKVDIQEEQTRSQILRSAALNERTMGAYVRAETLARRSYEMARRLFGADYLETQLSRLTLGDIHAHQGRIPEALAEAEPSATAIRRLLGDGSPRAVRLCSKLTLALGLGGHPDEAIRQGRLAYDWFRRNNGNGATVAADLAAVLTNAGRATEAEQLSRETLADLARLKWRNEYVISDIHRALAGSLAAQNKTAEAEAVLLENHATLAKLPVDVSDQVRLTVDALATLYERTGELQQAAGWRARRPPEPAPGGPPMP
jgi:tetratricopeptide (TPR) repeat protein